MKNKCSIVRDILPLYYEKMVSEETAAFVEEHLAVCDECAEMFREMKQETEADADVPRYADDSNVLKTIKKKMRRKNVKAGIALTLVVFVILTLLHYFPVYRIYELDYINNTISDVRDVVYIGSSTDRKEAQKVLREADKAFSDFTHTEKECEKLYGRLACYASPTDIYDGAEGVNYDLKLWSAYIYENSGRMWVKYSKEVLDDKGECISGSWNCIAEWHIEKNKNGEWKVTEINESPHRGW